MGFGRRDEPGHILIHIQPDLIEAISQHRNMIKPEGGRPHSLFNEPLGVIEGGGRPGDQLRPHIDHGREENQAQEKREAECRQGTSPPERLFKPDEEGPDAHREDNGPEDGPHERKNNHDASDNEQTDNRQSGDPFNLLGAFGRSLHFFLQFWSWQ